MVEMGTTADGDSGGDGCDRWWRWGPRRMAIAVVTDVIDGGDGDHGAWR